MTVEKEVVDPVYAKATAADMQGMSIAGRRALRDKIAVAKIEQKAGSPGDLAGAAPGGESSALPGGEAGGEVGGTAPMAMRIPQRFMDKKFMDNEAQGKAMAQDTMAVSKGIKDRMTSYTDEMRRRNSRGVGLGSNG